MAQMTEQVPATAEAAEQTECPRCGKIAPLCVCADIEPFETRVSLVILQHPQEQDKALGTARLAALHFKDAVVKIGLSWASLSKILGYTADPQRWAILYLGSARAEELAPDRDLVVLDKKGQAEERQGAVLRELEGVIVLDGTWSQAKALWWRNAWMLKCRRVLLNPSQPSRYGNLRKEARRDGLSTIESTAMLMSRIEGRPEIEQSLLESFNRLLDRYRAIRKATPGFDRDAGSKRQKRFGQAKSMRRRRFRS
jgi:DTW domain-containing protein